MKSGKVLAKLTVAALAAATLLAPALAQSRKGGVYVYHSKPIGKCPGLDWHINLDPNGQLVGFVSWDRMQHMAHLEGSLQKDGDFQMNAKETGGAARQAVVKGKATGDYLTIQITGSGTDCDNHDLQVPRFEGGLEGGGG